MEQRTKSLEKDAEGKRHRAIRSKEHRAIKMAEDGLDTGSGF
jgi:hypothetical protein